MADIAIVFQWAPSAMNVMGVAELMLWRERAIERLPILLRGKQ